MTRIAVVGAGVMGCATAWALRDRGADVTVYEQFELEHTRGSSHGRTRIVRLAYPDPEWVRLAEQARAAWWELEISTGRRLLELYGFLELAPAPELTSQAALAARGGAVLLLEYGARLASRRALSHAPTGGGGAAAVAHARATADAGLVAAVVAGAQRFGHQQGAQDHRPA